MITKCCAGILVAICLAAAPSLAVGEGRTKYRVLGIEYKGDLNKPIRPIIISDSSVAARWFCLAVLKCGEEGLVSVDIVTSARLQLLMSRVERFGKIGQRHKAKRSSGRVLVTLIRPVGVTEYSEDGARAISLLENLKALTRSDALLQSHLSNFELRVRPLIYGQK